MNRKDTSCSCCHGGRCTCAIKKEHHLDSVPELAAPTTCASTSPTTTATATEIRKPRLQMTHSESSLTTFANGHHRPTHKHHPGVHGSSPYTIPHVGHTGHTFGEHIGGCTKAPAATVSAPSSAASQKPRRIKSEHSSPDLRSYPALKMPAAIAPLELTPQLPPLQPQPIKPAPSRVQPGLSVNTNHPPFPLHDFRNQELLPSADSECSGFPFSAGLFPPQSAGWSPAYARFENPGFDDPPLDTNSYDPTSQLDINYLRFQSSAGLGGSVSGDEIEEMFAPNNLGGARTITRSSSSDASDQAESDYRVSATSSFVGLQQSSLLLQRNGFDEADALNSSLGASQPDPFDGGLIISPGDGQLDNETRGLSLYEGYSEGYLSPKDVTVKTELPSLPPIQSEESEYLWMSGWTPGAVQNGTTVADRPWQ